jgi:hypothetical protein
MRSSLISDMPVFPKRKRCSDGFRRSWREEASRNEVVFLANEARIDHLQLAYRAAAAKYAEAAALVGVIDQDKIETLRQVDGISHVEAERTISIPPPDSAIQ